MSEDIEAACHKTHLDTWDPNAEEMSTVLMIRRIRTVTATRGWRHAVRFFAQKNIPLSELRVVEVGCGTATYSLTLGLLGASVTLIDGNPHVLEGTRKIYEAFGCPARFIQADCLDPLPPDLEGGFDFVLSGGLAEHFTGEYRERCIRYHRLLLKEGRMAMIGVPNRWSPGYQGVRAFRSWTGTWGLDVEVPFSHPELKRLAREAGFKECYILGAASLAEDVYVYSRGLVSAVVDLWPGRWRESARGWKVKLENKASSLQDLRAYASEYCRRMLAAAIKEVPHPTRYLLSDWLSAGLHLVGFR